MLSFVLDGMRTEDVGRALDRRASPCAPGTTARSRPCAASASRARCAPSLAFYNTEDEVRGLGTALRRIVRGS